MVQERIKELEEKEHDNPLNEDNLEKFNEKDASMFSEDDEQDQERQHLLQIEVELKRKILTEHPIRMDDFLDPEIMKKVVYVNQPLERDTFNRLLTPRKKVNNTTTNNINNTNSNSKDNQ